MCKNWLADQSSAACLARCIYEDAISPMHMLLVEDWCDPTAMRAYLSSEAFRALIAAVKVLGTLVDVRISEATLIEDAESECD